jgi:adenylosuccinate lyase
MTNQEEFKLKAISPLDGRYSDKTSVLAEYCSEYALIKYRVIAEVKWLQYLSSEKVIPQLSVTTSSKLKNILDSFDINDALKVKNIELQTNHDVKAIEYFLAQTLEDPLVTAFIHFGCTSEDINNIAYALMLSDLRKTLILNDINKFLSSLQVLSKNWSETSMLSHTHGQPASPTTLGKELAVFYNRISSQLKTLNKIDILAKMNGAVGNFNAHQIALPNVNWIEISNTFIRSLGLIPNSLTTQIEPHDWIAEYAHALIRINTILIDFSRDIWLYISNGYLRSKPISTETGSSTMPHKVNPIDFENAEGNLGVSNALLNHLALKLPISRLQRDLSDSTVLRNLGSCVAYQLIALKSLHKGLSRIDINQKAISSDLESEPEVLAEAIQTVMRSQGISDAYDQLKEFTRGKKITIEELHIFISKTEIDNEAKLRLLNLKASDYIGLAKILADHISSE